MPGVIVFVECKNTVQNRRSNKLEAPSDMTTPFISSKFKPCGKNCRVARNPTYQLSKVDIKVVTLIVFKLARIDG